MNNGIFKAQICSISDMKHLMNISECLNLIYFLLFNQDTECWGRQSVPIKQLQVHSYKLILELFQK